MMNNRAFFLAPAVALALLAAACGTDKITVTSPDPNAAEGITVTGQGQVQATPDTGFFDIGVEVTAATVDVARDRAATAADAVISSVKKDGVDAKDVQTRNLSIQPQYDYSKNNQRPTITGYTVTNTVSVKVRKLDTLSTTIDDAVRAGGDAVRLQGIRFEIEDNAKALEQARDAAMADARKKADQLAKAGGVSLGKPISITETQANPPQPVRDAVGLPAGAASTPIEPGTTAVTVNVQVRWAVD
ncbi:MAG: SIMPL domain-containing protein [Chloroflexi bacterium]|nr:SIMPL domain-containing protein [Chloroflexota bacterium]